MAWGVDHPPNKNEMSRRLALQLLHAAYALQTPPWGGPVLQSAELAADGSAACQVTLTFV